MSGQLPSDQLSSFACRVAWAPEWGETIYNRVTAGQAKHDHFRHVHDAWDNTKFTDIRVRKIGAPHTSQQFVRNAQYRGMPGVRCGDRVMVGDSAGTIAGHNSSANFNVLFHSGKYAGLTLNVHPSEIELCQSK